MENTQNILSGKMWRGLFQAIKGRISAGCLKKSQKPTFQCLIAEDGQQQEWLEAGGGSTAWRVLDAQYWGVPQRRKRIYLVHSFGNERAGQILFERESMFRDTAQGRTEGQDTSADVGSSVAAADKTPTVFTIAGNAIGRTGRNGGNQLGIGQDISYTLTAADRHCVAVPEYKAYRLSGYGEYKEGVGTLKAKGGDYPGGETIIVEKELQFAEAYQHHGYRISETANTLTAGGNAKGVRGDTGFVIEKMDIKKGEKQNIAYQIRRQTPTECERLDGFPDGWTQQDTKGNIISDNARYMALGNSIAVPCAVRVFQGIVAVEAEVGAVAKRKND